MTAKQLLIAMMTTRCPDENLCMELIRNSKLLDHAYDKAQEHQSARRTARKQEEVVATSKNCYRCDKPGHKKENCWTHMKKCYNCGTTGHARNMCRSKQQ